MGGRVVVSLKLMAPRPDAQNGSQGEEKYRQDFGKKDEGGGGVLRGNTKALEKPGLPSQPGQQCKKDEEGAAEHH